MGAPDRGGQGGGSSHRAARTFPRVARPHVVLGSVLLSLAVLAATSQPWVEARLPAGGGTGGPADVAVAGNRSAPLVASTALVVLACAGALTLSGPRARRPVLLLAAAAAGLVLVGSAGVLRHPAEAARPALAAAVGLTPASLASAQVDAQATAWPWAAAVLGGLLALLNGIGLLTCGSWRQRRRFEQPPVEGPGQPPAPPVPIGPSPRDEAADTWDALSRGEDPTRGRARDPGQG